MDILICSDQAYLKGLVVTVESLLAHANSPCRIYLALDGVSEQTQQLLRLQWNAHPKLESLQTLSLQNVPAVYRGNCHFSRAAYGKVTLEPLAEFVSGSLLILDPDIIVQRDVTELAHIAFEHQVLAAASDVNQGMFNSGVMLVDLPAWSAYGVEAKLIESWKADPNVKNAEQDLLNRVITTDWLLPLDGSWNVPAHRWEPGTESIVHCIGGRKPWHGDYRKRPDLQQLFYRYLDQTFLRGQREVPLFGSLKRRWNKWRIGRERAA